MRPHSIHVTLSDEEKDFVDQLMQARGLGSAAEVVRELIHTAMSAMDEMGDDYYDDYYYADSGDFYDDVIDLDADDGSLDVDADVGPDRDEPF